MNSYRNIHIFFAIFLVCNNFIFNNAFGEDEAILQEINEEMKVDSNLNFQNEVVISDSDIGDTVAEEQILKEINEGIKSLNKQLGTHNETTSLNSNIALFFGGSIGIMGLAIAVISAVKETNRRKTRKKRFENSKIQIKNALIKSYENLEILEKKPPKIEDLKKNNFWREINDSTKFLRLKITTYSQDLKEELHDEIQNYVINMERHYERVRDDKRVHFPSMKNVAKRILDEYFQNWEKEEEEKREAEMKYWEEEKKRLDEEQEREFNKWIEEQIAEGHIDPNEDH